MASRQSGDARRPVAAAFDAFGGWCFVDGEVLAVRVSGRMAAEFERGSVSIGGARRDKCQNSRFDPRHARGQQQARRG